MIKRRLSYFLAAFAAFLASLYFFIIKEPSHCINLIPIQKFSDSNTPCISIQIDHLNLSLEFDSGFQGEVVIKNRFLEQIEKKTFNKEIITYGIRGNEYRNKAYTIPNGMLGNLPLKNVIVRSSSEQFDQDSIIFEGNPAKTRNEKIGRIGWGLFKNYNLVIDIPNLKIGHCDCFQTLQKNGYSSYSFVKVPLLENQPYIGIQIESESKLLNCVIDTGATVSALKSPERGSFATLDSIQISGHDFGPLEVLPIPIGAPPYPDMILGMNFLSEHIVFIDFKEQCAYISY